MGRPPLPLEHHRRVGRANGDKKADGRSLPERTATTALTIFTEPPAPLSNLQPEGLAMWGRIWSGAGRSWLGLTDIEAVDQTCRLADDLAIARARFRSDDGSAVDGRLVAALDKQLQSWLSQLGFTPSARSRLGVAEVKAASTIEQLRARRANPDRMAAETP